MAQILDELVLALDIDDKQFQAGEQAVVAGLDRLTAVMARVVETFDNGEKKNREALDKTGKQADKTAKGMEVAGKKASSFFSSIRSQVLALAGVTLSLHGLKNFVAGFTQHLNQLATAADAFGMSAKSLDGWTKAGEAFGVSANEIVGAFSRINDAKARLQAGLGLDPHLQSLLLAANQAGVNVDLSRDSTQDIMRKLTAAFPHLNTAQQQAYGGELGLGYAAQQWMGSGHALQDVERFTAGSGVDEDAIAAAKRFREQWAAISQAFEKTGYILFTALLPYLKQFNDWLNELAAWMAAHPEDIKNAVRGFLDTLKGVITLANDAAGAMGGWKNVILTLIGLKFAGWLWGVYRAVAAMLGLGGGAATGAAGAGIATALTRIAPWAALVIPTNNTPSTGEEMQELERLKRENWSKNNPGVPYRAVPRGIRNNNPGNLNYAGQEGATKEPGEQGRFAVFSTMQAGIAALYRQLQRYLGRGINTIAAIVQKYAPSADGNNVNAYIQALTRKLGLDANARLDPGNTQQMITLMEGIIGHENGAGYLSRADIAHALPQPGAGMAAQSRQPVAGAQSTVNETIHIGTLNATTTANNLKGVTDDARAKINRSSLVTHSGDPLRFRSLDMTFSLNQATVLNAVRGGGLLSVVNSVLSPGYGIYYASGNTIGSRPFSPTSFVVVEMGGEAVIGTAPVEKGGYTTFNKIQRPAELHMTFTVEGWTGFAGGLPNLTNLTLTSRSDVLATLETMRTTAAVYDIDTPDKTYAGYDLTQYDYRIRSDGGPTLLTVTAVFQAVQDVADVTVSSETSQASPTDNRRTQGASARTESVTPSTTGPTLDEVKKAQTGIVPAFQRVAGAVSSAVDDVRKSLGEVVISPRQKLDHAVDWLARSLT